MQLTYKSNIIPKLKVYFKIIGWHDTLHLTAQPQRDSFLQKNVKAVSIFQRTSLIPLRQILLFWSTNPVLILADFLPFNKGFNSAISSFVHNFPFLHHFSQLNKIQHLLQHLWLFFAIKLHFPLRLWEGSGRLYKEDGDVWGEINFVSGQFFIKWSIQSHNYRNTDN